MNTREHPYAPFLSEVKKPAQYLGGEQGEKRKDWDSVACRMCLAFPDLYEIGMSHLGYKILYGLLNDHPKLLAERAYAVWPDMEAKLREHGEPLRALESMRPLSDFDVVGFSLQYELTYSNILQMLELGGIPRWAKDRGEDDPLVVAGGPVATHGEPLAPFIDVFLIGDGEEKTAELLLTWAALRDSGMPRHERLVALAKLGGLYVPSLYDTRVDDETGLMVVEPKHPDAPYPVERTFVADLTQYEFPADGPVASTETIFDRVSVEVARGCTEGCRFCQAGMIYRPVRERDPVHIIDTIEKAVREGGYDEASLTSLSTADYSAIAPLVQKTMERLDGKRVNVSVSSLRAYGLSEDVLDDMKSQRAGGLTFAPEAGTQRMRDVVNKNVTEEQLLTTAERVFSRGWTKMKLYFMIGLPTEQDDDVVGIIDTGHKAWERARDVRGDKRGKVTVSVSSFVPKPHTPFQWCAMDTYDTIQRKQRLLRDEVRQTRVQLRMHDSAGSWLEGILARGDRRLAAVISDAYDAGCRFDSWDDQLDLESWRAAVADNDIDDTLMLGTLPITARVPWDHIDVGLEDGFLAREYRKALKDRLSPPCGKAAGDFVHHTNLAEAQEDARKLVCYDCGIACDMTQMRGERLVKLGKLGAEAPRVMDPSKAPVVPEEPAPELSRAERRKKARTPVVQVAQGERARVRIEFQKTGRFAFQGHLDLVRLFPRMFRRLDLPLFYSEGFHPRPEMTFSPALSLGIAGLGEFMDLKLRAEVLDDNPGLVESLVERLNGVAFDGVRFKHAARLGPHDPALSKVLEEAEWVAAIPRSALGEFGFADERAFLDAIRARFDGDENIDVMRDVKGIGRRIPVREVLRSVDIDRTTTQRPLVEAGYAGDLVTFGFNTWMRQSGSVRPVEVVEAVTSQQDMPARFIRVKLRARRDADSPWVSPMNLDALRRLPKKPATTDADNADDTTEPAAVAPSLPAPAAAVANEPAE